MKSIFTGIFLLINLFVSAQLEEKAKLESDIVPALSINTDFNAQDWYLGFSAGVEDMGYGWGARLGFNFRPFYKKTQVDDGAIIRQYREQKYFLSLDLDKRFFHFYTGLGEFQFFAGAKAGFLFGNYKGTQDNAKPYGVIAPMGGISLNPNDAVLIKAGYCLFNDRLREVSDSRIALTFIFTI